MTQLTLLEASQALVAGVSQTFPKGAAVAMQFDSGDWQNFVEAVRAAEGNPSAARTQAADAAQVAADYAAQAHAAQVQALNAQDVADNAMAVAAAAKSKSDALGKQALDAQSASDDAAAKAATGAKPLTAAKPVSLNAPTPAAKLRPLA